MSRERQMESALAEQQWLKSQLHAVRSSFSYRLGNMLVEAVVSPGPQYHPVAIQVGSVGG